MARARRRGGALVFWIIILALAAAAIWWGLNAEKTVTANPKPMEGPLNNPLSGFAPSADYYEIVGDHRLVYVDVTWRELEPEPGRFDFAAIEKDNHLDEWRVKGKHVVFRFLCDVPGDERHMDIPDWLYEATGGDGDWYDTDSGRGYSPNYANPLMIDLHRKAIAALGDRFGRDEFFSFIELGSLGHWGEWHTKHDSGIDPLPPEDVRRQYIQPYLESFPHAMLMMRRPFRAVQEHGFGLFNDMTGEPESTEEWLRWIQVGGEYEETGERDALKPVPDAWMTAPMGGELTGDIPMKGLLEDGLERTVALIRQSHMTFLGPKCPVLPEDRQYREGIDAVLSVLGSRLRVSRVELSQPLLFKGDLTVRLDWVNDGSAPFYHDWETALYLLDSQGRELARYPVEVRLSDVIDSEPVITKTVIPAGQLPAGSFTLALAVLDPATGYPAYTFAMEGMRPDRLCVLGQWVQD